MRLPRLLRRTAQSMEGAVVLFSDLESMPLASTNFAYLRAVTQAFGAKSQLLYFGSKDTEPPSEAAMALAGDGLKLAVVSMDGGFKVNPALHGQLAKKPALFLEWARKEKPRSIHLVGDPHIAYYLLQARKVGLLDWNVLVHLHVVTSYAYRVSIGRSAIDHPADLAQIQLECASLALADSIVTQSQTIADWMVAHQDVNRSKIEIAPSTPIENLPDLQRQQKPAEEASIAFAGTLTETKGIATFAYALRHLNDQSQIPLHAIFAGRLSSDFPAEEFLASTLGEASISYEICDSLDHFEFLKQISNARALVVASRLDENPAIIQECEILGIPVIATAVGDNEKRDLAEPDCVKIVPHDYLEIADALQNQLTEDTKTRAAPPSAQLNDARKNAWSKLVKNLSTSDRTEAVRDPEPMASDPSDDPLVSLCVVHYNRPELLEQTLESIFQQTYDNIEVIVVDDGSKNASFDEASRIARSLGEVTILRSENRYPGHARNLAASHARGKYLLFKDDDNYSKPNEIATFVSCAKHSGADILTCFSDNFSGTERPDSSNLSGVRRLPFGSGLGYNLVRNGFGDTNCLVLRDIWEKLGGFSEHYRIGLDDHEFFLRAQLKGYKIELIPDALYYYRLGIEKIKRRHTSKLADEQRIMSTLFEHSEYSIMDIASVYLIRSLVNKSDQT